MAIITLTSDFGKNSFLPAALKGLLLNTAANLIPVDISHHISPYNYNEATYIFRNSFKFFPLHSYHVVFFNLFDAIDTRLIMAFHAGHYFIIPDNGLLSMILNAPPDYAIELPIPTAERGNSLAWAQAAVTAIEKIEQGAAVATVGKETDAFVTKNSLRPKITDEFIDANVIYIDAFENVVVNLTEPEFEAARRGRSFTILIKGDEPVNKISNHYAQVAEGGRLVLFNSAGYLEIAVNKGNAAGLFGLRAYHDSKASKGFMESRMFYQTVRILFDD